MRQLSCEFNPWNKISSTQNLSRLAPRRRKAWRIMMKHFGKENFAILFPKQDIRGSILFRARQLFSVCCLLAYVPTSTNCSARKTAC